MCKAFVMLGLAAGVASAAPRDVQFVRFDVPGRIVELHNLGSDPVDLSGWRTCSHSGNQIRRYSAIAGLDGITIASGESLFIHLLNDAPTRPNAINATTIGGQFANLTTGAYGLSIYFPNAQGNVLFTDGNLIADHIQWNIGGIDDPTADERSDEAVAGGVWTAVDEWVETSAATEWVLLVDLSGAALHGPVSYQHLGCIADSNRDGVLDFFDISIFLSAFSGGEPRADINFDGVHDFFDVSEYLGLFTASCP